MAVTRRVHVAPAFFAFFMLAVIGCGGSTPITRPEDMSAAAHRQRADADERAAAAEEAQYDPEATSGGGRASDDPLGAIGTSSNPTEAHRTAAEEHRRHAAEHRAAAEELERFEEAQCGAIPAAERASCPLLESVASVQDIPGGVRLQLAEGADAEGVRARIACHIAFGRTQGRAGMDACALYVRSVSVEAGPRPDQVDLNVSDPADLSALRSRARTHAP